MKISKKFGAAATLALAAAAFAQPANDFCDSAEVIGVGATSFDNSTATLDGVTNCGFNTGKDIWYSFTSATDGTFTISTCGGAGFDTVLTAYDGCGGNVLACNDDACGLQSSIAVIVTANVPVIIRLASYNDNAGGAGTMTITGQTSSGNDLCADATPVVVGSNPFDNSGATTDGTAPCGGGGNKDIWFTFNPPADGDYVFTTCGTAAFDTMLTAFDACGGNSLACNDDACALQSSMEVDGLLAGTPVIIRLANFGAGGIGGTGTIEISALGPTDPTGFGQALPDPAFPGDVVQLAVTVTPGVRPISSGITVTGDLSAIGGGSSETFYDDATNGDDFAGDNIFSRLATIPADFAGSSYTISFSIADAEGRSGSGSFNGSVTTPAQWTEMGNGGGDAGELPGTAQIPAGDGSLNSIGGQLDASDSDMFKIQICDAAGFSASTVSDDTTGDTQLWLFTEDGHGVEFNDDDTLIGGGSAIGAQFVSATGVYYIAVSQYNRDATDDVGQLIWANAPFNGVRAPDGPGAANIIAGWDAGVTAGLSYRLNLTGACFAGGGCSADFNGDSVVDFFDYLDFVQAFADNDPSADFNADTVIDFFDYLDFVQAFAEGC